MHTRDLRGKNRQAFPARFPLRAAQIAPVSCVDEYRLASTPASIGSAKPRTPAVAIAHRQISAISTAAWTATLRLNSSDIACAAISCAVRRASLPASRIRLSSAALLSSEYAATISAAGTIADPDPAEVARVPHDVLMRFVGELPDGYRAVFNLYCIEGLPHREIAEMLGINEKSSSSQLFRARNILARRIKDYLKTH